MRKEKVYDKVEGFSTIIVTEMGRPCMTNVYSVPVDHLLSTN